MVFTLNPVVAAAAVGHAQVAMQQERRKARRAVGETAPLADETSESGAHESPRR